MISTLGSRSLPKSASARTQAPERKEAPQDGFAPQEKCNYEPGQLLVKMREGSNLGGDHLAENYPLTVAEDLTPPVQQTRDSGGKLLLVNLEPGQDCAKMKADLAKDPRVEYAEFNHNDYHLADGSQPGQFLPNDLQTALWGMNNTGQSGGKVDADIDAPEAWTLQTGNRDGAPIAVIDTGIDYKHKDLINNMWQNPGEIPGNGVDDDGNGVVDDVFGFNAFANSGDPMDGHSHGTHCAGSIAAEGDNREGVVGVNHKAQLMAVKIFNNGGSTNAAAIIRGINYASRMGARVTSNSWGGGSFNQAVLDAFKNSPSLHIMAAGNDGTDNDKTPHYPSNYDLANSIAVAASDRYDSRARFSCYGKETVDIAAPGKDILSTIPNDGYGYKSGTSMATPHVTGVAGLVLAQNPDLSNDQIKEAIFEGSDKLPNWEGVVAGGRRLNAYGALSWQPPTPPAEQPPVQQPPAQQPPAAQQPPVEQPPAQQPPAQQPPAQQPPAEQPPSQEPPAGQR